MCSFFSNESYPSSRAILSTAASITASAILYKTIASDIIPEPIQNYFYHQFQILSKKFQTRNTAVIYESNGLTPNQMFEAADVYLGSKISASTSRIKVNKGEKDKELTFSIDKKEEFSDRFNGVSLKWVLLYTKVEAFQVNPRKGDILAKSHAAYFEISFHKKHTDLIRTKYLPYILEEAKIIKQKKKDIKLHTVDYNGVDYWSSINFKHPATFDKIAMDPNVKKELLDDLNKFRTRKDYYERVGKAWKRGYLLYGPPGTGKSSLVAAMANYLNFDIYDLDLKEVQCNSDLRRLLIGTASKSILVIEDIDCSRNRDSAEDTKTVDDEKVTLSALLNFIDGLWSTCGDERIIIFTTNYKDRIDQALLRPGRMDVQIHMSYCTFCGFKILAANYLRIQDHPLYKKVQQIIDKVQMTPAEVAGELMKSDDATNAIRGLINFLQMKGSRT